MGKIKVIKKSTLSGRAEANDYKIYPVTKTDAVFTDSDDKDECDTQTPQGANKTAKEIFNSIRKKGWVNKERIKDGAVTWGKLTPEAQKVIEAGIGVDGDLVHDMEEWNDRIATLESAKLQPKTIIESTDVVEWIDNNTVIPVNISLQDEQGHIDNDSNYTDKQLLYSYQNSKETSTQGEVSFNVSFNNPDKVTIVANGYSKYKNVNVIFPSVTKTVYAVLPSYIGYADNIDNWNKNGQKIVKHSLNGSYNVTNDFKGDAYLAVAIPKNGAVEGIHTIVQHGMLDARQSVSTYEKDGYTLYVCKTAHNPGTYNFIIS